MLSPRLDSEYSSFTSVIFIWSILGEPSPPTTPVFAAPARSFKSSKYVLNSELSSIISLLAIVLILLRLASL